MERTPLVEPDVRPVGLSAATARSTRSLHATTTRSLHPAGNPYRLVQYVSTKSSEVRFDENLVCDRCGRFGAYAFDDEHFCTDCYATRCSCCPEFGVDDLWTRRPSGDPIPEGEAGPRSCAKP
jgi:hypothetical protein